MTSTIRPTGIYTRTKLEVLGTGFRHTAWYGIQNLGFCICIGKATKNYAALYMLGSKHGNAGRAPLNEFFFLPSSTNEFYPSYTQSVCLIRPKAINIDPGNFQSAYTARLQ